MTDAMEIARNERQDHIDRITEMEAEIDALRERIGELDIFLDFGETLLNGDMAEAPQPAPVPAHSPIARVQSRNPEIKSVEMIDEWDADADAGDDFEDDDDADEDDPIARVIAAHGG